MKIELNKIGFVGDIHAQYDIIEKYAKEQKGNIDCLFQVGDFGIYPHPDIGGNILPMTFVPEIPVYFIDGNHEHFPFLNEMCQKGTAHDDGTIEIFPNLFYVPRGTTLTFPSGKRLGAVGGASSVDIAWRKKGISWWEDENIDPVLIDQLIEKWNAEPIDILVVHTPPTRVIIEYFGRLNTEYWELPHNWIDKNAELIWKLLVSLDVKPKVFCGHMHRSVYASEYNTKVLGINELDIVDIS